MRPGGRALPLVWGGVLALAACGPGPPPPPPVPQEDIEPDPCVIVVDSLAPAPDSITVVVTASRRPDGPGEGLIARHIYETLIRVDCAGRARPGIALAASRDSTGTVWTFELPARAQFADGSRLDAEAVRASWERRSRPGSWPWSGIRDVVAVNPTTLVVRLDSAASAPPIELGDPALGIIGGPTPRGREAGSGPYRVTGIHTGPDSIQVVVLTPYGWSGPTLRVEFPPVEYDPRDRLDRPRGAEVVISRDPAVKAYAAGRGDLGVVSLPWDQSYVLVVAAPVGPVPPDVRAGLARDAVRAEARGAEPPLLALDGRCATTGPGRTPPRPGREIGYLQSDPVARALAERIVALATASDPPAWLSAWRGAGPLRVTGLEPAALDSALATGALAGFLVRVPRSPRIGCVGVPVVPPGFTVVPLIDTHANVIVTPGVPPFWIEVDGTVSFLPDGRKDRRQE